MLKYLKCIDCWLSFKNKTIWVILQRLALIGNGTKFSSIFLKPLHDFGARTWDALLYSLWYFPSALIALSDWRQTAALPCRRSLGDMQMTSLSFMAAWNENPFVIHVNLATHVLTRDLDIAYSWFISLCSMDTHKNPEFCFLGKYCNSGLMSPSESLEPEVTLSQADNAQRCRLASLQPFPGLVHIRTHYCSRSVRTFR